MASLRGLDLVKAVVAHASKNNCYGKFLNNVNFISAGDGQCKAEFIVADEHLNSFGTLHGGCTSTIIDCISTYALMTNEKALPGVSVDLHVTFLKAAFPGDTIVVDAKTIKCGKKLAFLEVELAKKKDGIIIARGQHTKFIAA
ncbi:hypothetical protein PV327_002986 [Microctonus hyperodae]|uniref:Thioesterase domain-containing protein n=1 Tax=Microctonus hyperodae TaxID=165561 RepID=A0AA39L0F3_MICHY|nr:hypothetical protein PV327_002986 [Microctonus hyperodae]